MTLQEEIESLMLTARQDVNPCRFSRPSKVASACF